MKQKKFSVTDRIKSFKYAFNGLKILLNEEHNARIHLIAAICAIAFSIYFEISATEWVAVVFAIGFVFAMELINSSIENISDFVSPGKNESIKKIKDLSAASVLISAITAFTVGLIVFIPKVIELIQIEL
ncbi:MAG: diacylglycerol kinase [Bacteroidetes bacterium GWF2_38_335]|nr:MAG: diacylglycerol kinase [Bacteroidetes bacterium GWF2_38_335]HBS88040.1 diacylglycerol kinase [Bacteroidales bacterium]